MPLCHADLNPVARNEHGGPVLTYLDWNEYATMKHRKGERQRRCPNCQKWIWPDEHPCKGKP